MQRITAWNKKSVFAQGWEVSIQFITLLIYAIAAFGAVDEPLASCMIVHFLAHILKRDLVSKFGVRFHIFIIISCLGSRFHE